MDVVVVVIALLNYVLKVEYGDIKIDHIPLVLHVRVPERIVLFL